MKALVVREKWLGVARMAIAIYAEEDDHVEGRDTIELFLRRVGRVGWRN